MKKYIFILGLGIILYLLASDTFGARQTIVVSPDTQEYTEDMPYVLTNITQWVSDNVATRNISIVLGQGDIINNYGTAAEWVNANTSYSILDNIVPWLLTAGNHDTNNGADYDWFNTYFNFTRYTGYSWYGGHYPVSGNENSYAFFNISESKWMVIGLSYGVGSPGLSWANTTVTNNADKNVIVLTHSYLNNSNGLTPEGRTIWDSFVKHHSNIKMVLTGHMGSISDGEGYLMSHGLNNNTVFQVLSDYQWYENNSKRDTGYIRLLEFINNNTLNITAYSPHLNKSPSVELTRNILLTFNEDCSTPANPATEDWIINTTCYVENQQYNLSTYDINITEYGHLWLKDTNITFDRLNVYGITGINRDVLTLDQQANNYFRMNGV